MKIALIPVYVDYYESTVPGLLKSKEALVKKVHAAIIAEHDVLLFDKVTDLDGARFARERVSRDQPDCVVVLPLVATFSALTDELVKGVDKPLVLFSPMMGRTLSSPMTMAKVVAESQSFGAQAAANGWMRAGVKFHVIHQIAGSREGNAAIGSLLKTLEVSLQARSLRIGLIGEVFNGMTDVLLPARQFQATGSRIIRIPMKRIHDAMERTSTPEIARIEKELRRCLNLVNSRLLRWNIHYAPHWPFERLSPRKS